MKVDDQFSDEAVRVVNECASRIIEHVDSVQIFVTKQDDAGKPVTRSYECGRGNFFARQAHVREWLIMQEEFERCEARRIDTATQEEN